MTITVEDSNEDIVLSGETAPNYAENGTGNVATYTATDGDGGTIIWDLVGRRCQPVRHRGGRTDLRLVARTSRRRLTKARHNKYYKVTIEASTATDTLLTLQSPSPSRT